MTTRGDLVGVFRANYFICGTVTLKSESPHRRPKPHRRMPHPDMRGSAKKRCRGKKVKTKSRKGLVKKRYNKYVKMREKGGGRERECRGKTVGEGKVPHFCWVYFFPLPLGCPFASALFNRFNQKNYSAGNIIK